jgi:hypothetical protein
MMQGLLSQDIRKGFRQRSLRRAELTEAVVQTNLEDVVNFHPIMLLGGLGPRRLVNARFVQLLELPNHLTAK